MGGYTETWVSAATGFLDGKIPAQKATHRSNEAVQAMAETGIAVHNFRIRYREDVKSSWRIKEGDRYYAIIGPPIEIERRRYLDITAKDTT
jgi:SPP1 family predicted phage head-tail adaptor